MDKNKVIKVLTQYNKWRRGKGKKYSQPGFPFDVKEIGEAIDTAIKCLKYRLDPVPFANLVAGTYFNIKKDKAIIRAMKKSKEWSSSKEMRDQCSDIEKTLPVQTEAVRLGAKIVKYLVRTGALDDAHNPLKNK